MRVMNAISFFFNISIRNETLVSSWSISWIMRHFVLHGSVS